MWYYFEWKRDLFLAGIRKWSGDDLSRVAGPADLDDPGADPERGDHGARLRSDGGDLPAAYPQRAEGRASPFAGALRPGYGLARDYRARPGRERRMVRGAYRAFACAATSR